MLQILRELRIDSKIIDFIVRIYRGDSTKIRLEENREIEIEVTSGIRQGCTASTVLFKLISDHIQNYRRNEKNRMNKNTRTKNHIPLLRRRWINISKRQRESRKKL